MQWRWWNIVCWMLINFLENTLFRHWISIGRIMFQRTSHVYRISYNGAKSLGSPLWTCNTNKVTANQLVRHCTTNVSTNFSRGIAQAVRQKEYLPDVKGIWFKWDWSNIFSIKFKHWINLFYLYCFPYRLKKRVCISRYGGKPSMAGW